MGAIFGVIGGVVLICVVFFIPYLHRRLVQEDWTLKWYHVFLGPLLLRRGEVPPPPAGHPVQVVQDYYRGHKTREELERAGLAPHHTPDIEANKEAHTSVDADSDRASPVLAAQSPAMAETEANRAQQMPAWRRYYMDPLVGGWYRPSNLPRLVMRGFMHGVDKDVVASQGEKSLLSGNLQMTHARVPHFDNKAEHLYSFLQIMTAAVSSFAHGANDVANAMGPLTAIYYIWNTGEVKSKADVPRWVL